MKKLLTSISILLLMVCIIYSLCSIYSLYTKHDGVDDDYSRGFYNALEIMRQRYHNVLQTDSLYPEKFPDWEENKRSYLSGVDLYNYWDSSYMYVPKGKLHGITVIKDNIIIVDSTFINKYAINEQLDSLNKLWNTLVGRYMQLSHENVAALPSREVIIKNLPEMGRILQRQKEIEVLMDSLKNN